MVGLCSAERARSWYLQETIPDRHGAVNLMMKISDGAATY
jgi:hypothetical protein